LLTRLWEEGARLHAVGCLTRCIVDEITTGGSADSCRASGKDQ
ncbi:MAG: hypothetical protein FD129_2362, partial [bacterium]